MRAITSNSIECFLNATAFKSGNMQVIVEPNVTMLKQYNTVIAYRYNDPEKTLSITNGGFKTNVTKDILNGLPNVNINVIKGVWYLNGNVWDGKLIDVE